MTFPISRAFSVVGLGIVLAVFPSCNRAQPHIHFVVPNGFRGAFIIYTNSPRGGGLMRQGSNYTCVIPDNGVLHLREEGPFFQWHTRSASYADGKNIPEYQGGGAIDDDTVAFWGGGSRGEGMVYDFIGTKAEKAAFYRETEAAEIKPGRIR